MHTFKYFFNLSARRFGFLYPLFMLLLVGTSAYSQTIQSASSEVSFKIKNLGVWVKGSLSSPTGTIVWDENQLSSVKINAKVAVSSIQTGIKARDKHLLKEDYFHASKYSNISFTLTSVEKKKDGWLGKGTLTIKGTSKQVSIEFQVTKNGSQKTFSGTFEIDRRDFGVGGNSLVLSDDVFVSFKLVVK